MVGDVYTVGQVVEVLIDDRGWTRGHVREASRARLVVDCTESVGLIWKAVGEEKWDVLHRVGYHTGIRPFAEMRGSVVQVGDVFGGAPLATRAPAADWRSAFPVGSECEVNGDAWRPGTGWIRATVIEHETGSGPPTIRLRAVGTYDVGLDGVMRTGIHAYVREVTMPPCPFCEHRLHTAHTVAVLRCEACGWAGSEAQRAKAAEPARPESPFKVGDWVRPAAEDIASADARTPRLHESVVGQVVALGEQNGRETVRIVWRTIGRERDTALVYAEHLERAERKGMHPST